MIAKINGRIDFLDQERLIIDVNGIGYDVQCSTKTLSELRVGETVSLHISTIVRQESFCLYGFLDRVDKNLFSTLMSVQGVGAKAALSLQSVLTREELFEAILSGDKTALSRASGVGKKLAARLALELKDKILDLPLIGSQSMQDMPQHATNNPLLHDATSALVNLGFARSLALRTVSRIVQENATKGIDANMDAIIPRALRELSR